MNAEELVARGVVGGITIGAAALAIRLRHNDPPQTLPNPATDSWVPEAVWSEEDGPGLRDLDPASWRSHLFPDRDADEMAQEIADALHLGLHRSQLSAADAAEGARRCAAFRAGGATLLSRKQCAELSDAVWREAGLPAPPARRRVAPTTHPLSAQHRAPAHAPPAAEPASRLSRTAHASASLVGRLALNAVGLVSRTSVVAGGRAKIHFYDSGADPAHRAPPLVLVHGMCTHGQCMASLALLFAGSRRVIVPDLIDFDYGYSSSPGPSPMPWTDQLPLLAAWIRGLDAPQVDLCGHSLGGWVAQRLAEALPRRVRRLVLLCPGGSGRYRVMASTASVLGPSDAVDRLFRLRAGGTLPRAVTSAVAAAMRAQFRSPHSLATSAAAGWDAYFGYRGRPMQPALVLWGTEDVVQLPRGDRAVLQDTPNGHGFWLIGADHFMVVTNAVTIYRLARAFLDGLPPAGAEAAAAAEAVSPPVSLPAPHDRRPVVRAPDGGWPTSATSAALQSVLAFTDVPVAPMDRAFDRAPPALADPARRWELGTTGPAARL